MKNYLFLLLLLVNILSCSNDSTKPFTGNDVKDITANKWLHQLNLKDHFLCFDEEGKGWEAEVENSTQQKHPWLSKNKFTFVVDTIQKIIIITYNNSKERKAWAYKMMFEDDRRILQLNGVSYIDGQDEISQFGSRFANELNSNLGY